jgi:2-oxoglutarate dehydrogenase E1 component
VKQLTNLREQYKNAEWVWVQEEPQNMGAQWYLQMNLVCTADQPILPLKFISRSASASPATGYSKVHKAEQEKIISSALEV